MRNLEAEWIFICIGGVELTHNGAHYSKYINEIGEKAVLKFQINTLIWVNGID